MNFFSLFEPFLFKISTLWSILENWRFCEICELTILVLDWDQVANSSRKILKLLRTRKCMRTKGLPFGPGLTSKRLIYTVADFTRHIIWLKNISRKLPTIEMIFGESTRPHTCRENRLRESSGQFGCVTHHYTLQHNFGSRLQFSTIVDR